MSNISKEIRKEITDFFGRYVVEQVRDGALGVSIDIVNQETVNPIKMRQYSDLMNLSADQQKAVCDLLSETVTDTIYRFLEMFEENPDKMRLCIIKDGEEYDMAKISEKMGSEIACYEDTGWIQAFSKIGRFVL